MNAKATVDAWHQHPVDRTGQTDDERIKDITVLPPPEHLMRFFPIAGTAVEKLIAQTRKTIHHILHGQDDPCWSSSAPVRSMTRLPRSNMPAASNRCARNTPIRSKS